MSFLDFYEPNLKIKVTSVLTNLMEYEMDWQDDHLQQPIQQAFLNADDIQGMTLSSSSLGFIRTYTKQYKGDE